MIDREALAEQLSKWADDLMPICYDKEASAEILRLAADALTSAGEGAVPVGWAEAHHRSVMASVRLGKWMSAALDDPQVCAEMKADIQEWFSAGEPFEAYVLAMSAPHPPRQDGAREIKQWRARADGRSAPWYDGSGPSLIDHEKRTLYTTPPAPKDGAREGELEREVERLKNITSRFPDLMARIIAAKDEPLDSREQALISALQALPEYFHGYQWEADKKQIFGDKIVRMVVGDNGHGMGRQWIATTPQHIEGLAEYIAASNPDTIAMLLTEVLELRGATRSQNCVEEPVAWQYRMPQSHEWTYVINAPWFEQCGDFWERRPLYASPALTKEAQS